MAIFQNTEFSGLLNMGVSDFMKKENELSAMKNVQEDKIGILKRVPGYFKVTKTGGTATTVNSAVEDVKFLHQYYQPSTANRYLIGGTKKDSDFQFSYKTATSEWTALTNGLLSGGLYYDFSAVNYLDKTFVVGYSQTQGLYAPSTTIKATTRYDTSGGDADLTGMPRGKYIVKYRDLLYVLNCNVTTNGSTYTTYRTRAYFCADPVNLALPTTGTLSPAPYSWQWNTSTNFVEFGQDDGEEITGGADCADRLVVFTQNSMWTYDENNKKKIADVGCISHKSISVINGILYWANRDGIWRWDGGMPQMISGKVQPMFDSISPSSLSNCVGVSLNFEYRLYIGTSTLEGIEYANLWIVFDIRREKFYIRSTFHSARSAIRFIDSLGKERIYFGGTLGYVYVQSMYIDGIDSDDGNEIDYFFITNELDYGAPQTVKQSPQICFYTKNASGIKYVIDGTNDGEFSTARGQLTTSQVLPRDIDVKGYRLKFKFYGKDKATPFIFEGFTSEFHGIENLA